MSSEKSQEWPRPAPRRKRTDDSETIIIEGRAANPQPEPPSREDSPVPLRIAASPPPPASLNSAAPLRNPTPPKSPGATMILEAAEQTSVQERATQVRNNIIHVALMTTNSSAQYTFNAEYMNLIKDAISLDQSLSTVNFGPPPPIINYCIQMMPPPPFFVPSSMYLQHPMLAPPASQPSMGDSRTTNSSPASPSIKQNPVGFLASSDASNAAFSATVNQYAEKNQSAGPASHSNHPPVAARPSVAARPPVAARPVFAGRPPGGPGVFDLERVSGGPPVLPPNRGKRRVDNVDQSSESPPKKKSYTVKVRTINAQESDADTVVMTYNTHDDAFEAMVGFVSKKSEDGKPLYTCKMTENQ